MHAPEHRERYHLSTRAPSPGNLTETKHARCGTAFGSQLLA
jgi:hypothetical protein